jgi:hypothetical protein
MSLRHSSRKRCSFSCLHLLTGRCGNERAFCALFANESRSLEKTLPANRKDTIPASVHRSTTLYTKPVIESHRPALHGSAERKHFAIVR